MKSLEEYFALLPAQIEAAAHKTSADAGQLGQDAARDTKLFKNNGALRAATNFQPTDDFSGFVVADKSYAVFLEEGNPYAGFEIKPIHGKFLHFFVGGKEVFAKKVKAHGPLPFMQEAQDKVEREIENIWNHNIDAAIERG